jgi:fatty acid desaturase
MPTFACEQDTAPVAKKGRQIRWYRTPIEKDLLRELSTRSDLKGAVQTLGYLGIYALTASLAVWSFVHWTWWVTAGVTFVHGMVTAFMINGVHELGHGTVFRTKWLNAFFCGVLSFLGWINHRIFQASHSRHPAYTLHPPDDLEVVLPIKLAVRHFWESGFLNYKGLWYSIKDTVRIARGQMRGPWELTLFPEGDLEKRRPSMNWARLVMAGHVAVVVVSAVLGWWVWRGFWWVPVVVTLAPFYGGWLFFLCNNTQHVGLADNVPDFRLCCRTFTLNPVVRVLYWQMNFHTEHHMYPTVPCYHLARLHEAVREDLPPCADGLLAVWREIGPIMERQKDDPKYQYVAIIPVRPAPTGGF